MPTGKNKVTQPVLFSSLFLGWGWSFKVERHVYPNLHSTLAYNASAESGWSQHNIGKVDRPSYIDL